MTVKLTPKYELLVDGAAVDPAVVEKVLTISVRQDLALADMVEVRLSNDDLFVSDGDVFTEGKELTVKLGYVETNLVTVATGTITRRECEFPRRGPAIATVVAYDKRFVLKHGHKTRAWKDVKDSDAVQAIASEAGLSADVDTTPVKHDYIFQPAQTDLAFVSERACLLGWVVRLDRENKKLAFKKPTRGNAAGVKLSWGENLFSFRPRFSTNEQLSEVTVRGWDMKAKKEVKGTATASDLDAKMGTGTTGTARAQSRYGSRSVLVTAAVATEDEAKAMANAYINHAFHSFARGHGWSQGENALAPGAVIEIDGVGGRAAGRYYVTAAFHHFEHRGYATYFEFERPGEWPPYNPPPAPPPPAAKKAAPVQEPPTWVEIELIPHGSKVDVVGSDYTLTLPDGRVMKGKIPASRKVRVEGIKNAGDVKIQLQTKDDYTIG